jgi:hypothetical protein
MTLKYVLQEIACLHVYKQNVGHMLTARVQDTLLLAYVWITTLEIQILHAHHVRPKI